MNRGGPAPAAKAAADGVSLRNILGNSSWVAGEQIVRLGLGLAISIAIARQLGPAEYGRLTAALAAAGLFGIISALGLNRFVARELAQSQTAAERERLLATAVGMRLLSVLPVAALAVSSAAAAGLAEPALVAILTCGYAFSACDLLEAHFQTQLRSGAVTRWRTSAFILSSAVKIALLLVGAPVVAFACAYVVDTLATSAALMIAFRRDGLTVDLAAFDRRLAQKLIGESYTEILAGFSGLIFMRMDQIMLNAMRGPADAGIMAVAVRMAEAWYFVPVAIVASAFPSIVRLRDADGALHALRMRQLFRLLTGMGILYGLLLSACAPWAIPLVFGAGYAPAVALVQITAWCGLLAAWGVLSGAWLVAEGLVRLNLLRNVVGAAVNLGLNFVLIPAYGAVGAASATLAGMATAYLIFDFFRPEVAHLGRLKLRSMVPW